MNRLEDELRAALKPEAPPPGFAERIIERLGEVPERRRGFVEAVLEALRPPKIRFAALGTVFAIVLIGLALYYAGRNIGQVPSSVNQTAEESGDRTPANPEKAGGAPGRPASNDHEKTAVSQVRQVRKAAKSQRAKDGEEARERLLLALQIASTTLTEARDAVSQSLAEGRSAR